MIRRPPGRRIGVILLSIIVLQISLVSNVAAQGDPIPQPSGESKPELVPELNAPPSKSSQLEWNPQWPQFRLIEGIGTAAMLGGLIAMEQDMLLPAAVTPKWSAPLLFDGSLREAIGAERPTGEEFAANISDIGMMGLIAAPILMDAVGAAGFGHGNWEVAGQLGLIAAQSLSFAAFSTHVVKRLTARERPLLSDCFSERSADPNADCENGNSRPTESFPSGHTSMAFAGAALVCTAHANLPLFGDGIANQIPCWASMAAAATTGAMRIVANRHHFTDVAVGAGIGLVAGGLIPWLLHFRERPAKNEVGEVPLPDEKEERDWSISPFSMDGGAGLQFRMTY